MGADCAADGPGGDAERTTMTPVDAVTPVVADSMTPVVADSVAPVVADSVAPVVVDVVAPVVADSVTPVAEVADLTVTSVGAHEDTCTCLLAGSSP